MTINKNYFIFLNFSYNSINVSGAKAIGENIGKLLNLTNLNLNLV